MGCVDEMSRCERNRVVGDVKNDEIGGQGGAMGKEKYGRERSGGYAYWVADSEIGHAQVMTGKELYACRGGEALVCRGGGGGGDCGGGGGGWG